MELNGLRIFICLRKSEVSIEMIEFCNVIENLADQEKHFFPCSDISEALDRVY